MRKTTLSLMSVLLLVLASCASSDSSKNMGQHYEPGEPKPVSFWWPKRLDLSPLRQHAAESNPLGERFNYAKEFSKLNLKEVKADIAKTLTDSRKWWPADWGNYGPLFIRLAWHSAGTYRVTDGRGGAAGGQHRLEPLNSWPDNANLDKARRVLWPVKKKYGKRLSWADLMVLAGNVSLETMGFKTAGFSGGRTDDWEPELVYWGSETAFLESKRHAKDKRTLKKPFGATRMGLIYVNPEGPNGVPDPLLAAQDIRENFARMAMNDEETVALIAGGHSFGKAHGAHSPEKCVGADPAGSAIEEQGLGWKNKCGKGHSEDTVTSGLEGAWTATPTRWSMGYLENLYNFEWELTTSPAGAKQWVPKDGAASNQVPDAHIRRKYNQPIMFTTDIALKKDPAYRKITQRFLKNPKEFERAFAQAWFKLTHRDMGPRERYVGSEIPKEAFKWQDPLPKRSYAKINSSDIKKLKSAIGKTGLSNTELVKVAWASASSYRATDMRGGANGARVRLAPQKDWPVNDPKELASALSKLEAVQKEFNSSSIRKVSLADIIVLAGAVGVESAAKKAGVDVKVPFQAGRVDATTAQTDVESFSYLEPKADAFRNYYADDFYMSPTQAMVDKANMLGLTVPELTVLVGGMRVLGANTGNSKHGIFTDKVGVLTNDFFVNLLDMKYEWKKSDNPGLYNGYIRGAEEIVYTATPVDLIFGSQSELRAIAEVYAANDAKEKMVRDFVKAWSKVMSADRFDLKR